MFYSLTKHGGQQFQKCYALFQKNPSYTHVLQNWFNAQYFVSQKDIWWMMKGAQIFSALKWTIICIKAFTCNNKILSVSLLNEIYLLH